MQLLQFLSKSEMNQRVWLWNCTSWAPPNASSVQDTRIQEETLGQMKGLDLSDGLEFPECPAGKAGGRGWEEEELRIFAGTAVSLTWTWISSRNCIMGFICYL